MAWQKGRILKTLLIVAASWFFVSPTVDAIDDLNWQTLTSFKDVRRMRLIHDTLWVATSGGLLAVVDPASPGRQYTNVDGLGTVDLTDIIEDSGGQKWVTGHGRLIRFTPADSRQFLFQKDNSLLALNCVTDDGDRLWVGTSIGLVLFSKTSDGGEIVDSYHLFGNLSANPDVHDVFVIGDTIWIATSAGLAVADKSNPILLNQPSVWTVFQNAQYPELQTSDFRRVVQFEGAIWTATAKGLSRLDRSSLDTSFTLLAGVSRTIYSELKIENDSLFAYNPYGMGVVKNSVYSTISLQGRPSGLITGANNGTFRWVGFSGNGVSHDRDLSGVVIPYPFTGSPGNYVTGIAVDRAGAVTAGFWDRKAGQFDGQVWTNVETRDWTTDVALDSSGVVWIGTWGGGIAGVHEDTVVYYDETNSTMRGIPSAPSFVVARGVAVDRRYIYAVCYDALNGYPVAIGDLQSLDTPSGWDSLGLADGVTNQLLVSVDCYKSRLAIGTEAAGVFVCYLGDDPFDHQARHCDHYTTESGLNSDVVRTVRYAPTGELWVGTNFGAARWDLDRFVAVQPPQGIGNDIMAIEFDGRGNLWLGSNDGLARVDGATGQATVYTTRTSGLVSDDITNLSFDPFTGDLYVATRAGISRLRSTIGRPTADVESVLAFPNPFVIRSDLDRLNFNFSRSGAVRIFSLAGELVAEFPVNTAWDGRNARGERVASGVYIFILTDSDGNVGRGKVLVVHEE